MKETTPDMTSRRLLLSLLALAFVPAILSAQPTYSNEVAHIFRAKCEQCHRDGDIAPFALKDYSAASTWAYDIRRVISSGVMPPWKPRPGAQHFRNDFSLSDDEKQTIFDWVDAGSPEGDPADLPEPITNKSPWTLGYPDQVISMSQPYTPAIGSDVYRCFVLDPGIDKTSYLSSIDVLPGARSIVHHVLLYAELPDQAGKYASDALDGKDGDAGYTCFGGPGFNINASNIKALLGGWAPGTRPYLLDEQYGMELGAKAKIVMQVHYFPVGRTDTDQTQIGLYYTKKKPQQTVLDIPLIQDKFRIPAGASSYDAPTYSLTLPLWIDDVKVIWAYPHMHLLGRKISIDVTLADKAKISGIAIDDWDFNWQGAYAYVTPLAVPGGATISLNCNYDNSADNPKNPNNPLVPVTWGERTTDEMCVGFVGLVSPKLELLLPILFK